MQRSQDSGLTTRQYAIYEGYIVQKDAYIISIARQAVSHAGPPRITIFHNSGSNSESGMITFMEGVVIGCYGSNNFFTTPVFMDRLMGESSEKLLNEIGIVDKIPELVKKKLKFDIVDNVIKF